MHFHSKQEDLLHMLLRPGADVAGDPGTLPILRAVGLTGWETVSRPSIMRHGLPARATAKAAVGLFASTLNAPCLRETFDAIGTCRLSAGSGLGYFGMISVRD